MSRFRQITVQEFHQLIGYGARGWSESGCVNTAVARLQRNGIVRTTDGRLAKVFRRPKSFLSSAHWRSYAARFTYASEQLARRGVTTVRVTGMYRVDEVRREVVIYEPLQGSPLRELVAEPARRDALLEELAVFLADLHRRGVHVRSMHLDNVLVLSDGGGFGVIDIAAVRFRRGALDPWARARDFRPFFSYETDRLAMVAFGVRRFAARYAEVAGIGGWRWRMLRMCLKRQHAELRKALSVC